MKADNVNNSMNFEDSFFDADSSSWQAAYSDLVTVLLCFFILFFALYSKSESISSGELIENSKSVREVPDIKILEINRIQQSLEKNKKFKLSRDEKSLVVKFPNVAFFKQDSKQLTLEGKYLITALLNDIYKYKENIIFEVTTYTQKNQRDQYQTSHERNLNIVQKMNEWGINLDRLSLKTESAPPSEKGQIAVKIRYLK